MSEHEVRDVNASERGDARFEISSKTIPNPYNFQFYVGYGTNTLGPWAVLGLNDTEYYFGYRAQDTVSKASSRPKVSVGAAEVVNAFVKTLN